MAEKKSRSYAVRSSGIHGRGVFATKTIRKGTVIVEYKGQRTSYERRCAGRTAIRTIPRTRSCSSSTTAG